jgi:uncharacterized protein YkwD
MRPHIGAALAVAPFALALYASIAEATTTRLVARAAGRSAAAHAASSACPGANLRPNGANAATIDAATLCLVDRARVAHHLRQLKTNRELHAVAVSQVKDMVRLDYFAHDRPSGKTPATLIAATRYGRHTRRLSTAENIGWGTGRYATPAQMVTAWLHSPPHREAILTGEYREAGVGATAAVPSHLAEGKAGATYALELARR